MRGIFTSDKTHVIFNFAVPHDFDIFIHQWCGCGCGYYQAHGFYGGDIEATRLDILTMDEARHMYE